MKEGNIMQLPTLIRPPAISLPPMYTWPRFIKRSLLVMSVLLVVAAYAFLTGGIVLVLVVLADRIGG